MNESINERLSAFMDDELPEPQARKLCGELLADADLHATWQRYHVIGDSLRNELVSQPGALLASLEGKLAEEPEILAPPPATRPWVRPLTGLAIAASVASLAVIGWYQAGPENGEIGPRVAVQEAPPAEVEYASTEAPLSTPRLNSYLMNHHERTSNIGMQGVMPYVQLVGYDPAAE